MVKYNFIPHKQSAVITQHELDDGELEMIQAIINWDKPNRFSGNIREMHGRSIVLNSPTRKTTLDDAIDGNYDALQLIGAGGNTVYVRTGVLNLGDSVEIHPVDPANHAKELRDNVQLRKVNDNGRFEFYYRDYVPLHGMDKHEADARSIYTRYLDEILQENQIGTRRLGFVVPKLAAEGYFPELRDQKNENLRFQAYRVPKLKRLPSQLWIKYNTTKYKDFVEYANKISYLIGSTLRNFQEWQS